MQLSEFMIGNWRSWAQETRVQLRTLTLLFGNNSSGKSALLRFLPALRDSVTGDHPGPLALASPALREPRFEELMTNPAIAVEKAPIVRFAFDWSDSNRSTRSTVTVRHLADQRRQVIDDAEYRVNGLVELSLKWQPPRDPAQLRGALTYLAAFNGDVVERKLDGSVLPPRLEGHSPDRLHELAEELYRSFSALEQRVHWLSAARAMPQRMANFPGSEPRRLGIDGEGAAARLAYDQVDGDGALLRRISRWYERATSSLLEVELEADRFSLSLRPRASTARVPLIDTGEGMAQVLPVLVLLGMVGEGALGDPPTVALEHPELHLHPSAQRELAMEFASTAAGSPTSRIIVETHSEHFLYGVQLAILRGELSPDEVAVYWVRQGEDGRSTLDHIALDELARPTAGGLPPGSFTAGIDMARNVVLRRREKLGG